jgi:hypothetical protein
MQSSTARSVVAYVLIGLALLGVILLGVQFAKNRSSQVASGPQPTETVQPTPAQDPNQNQPQNPNGQGEQPANPQPTATQPQPVPQSGGTLSSSTDSVRVPATGLEDIILTAVGATLLAFSVAVYVRSRRRLMTPA